MILVMAGGWAAGIVAAGLRPVPLALVLGGMVGAGAAALLARNGPVRLVALGLLALFLGLGRSVLVSPPPHFDVLTAHAGQAVLIGRALDGPVARGSRFEVDVEVEAVAPASAPTSTTALTSPLPHVLLRSPASNVRYGDRVEARGRLAAPRSRPGWPLAEILARRQVFWVLDAASVRTRPSADPGFWGLLARAHDWLAGNLRAALPEPQASLVAGMVLGARSGLPPGLRAALSTTGTTHLTAVSGLNVAIVAGGLMALARYALGARLAVFPTLLGVWLYALLVGAPPSALRAAVMLSAALVAQASGRLADPVVALALAVAALLAWDPSLAFDVGFQLSVAATAGLVLLSPSVDRAMRRLPKLVREPLAVTLAASIATLPIIVTTFQTLSIASLPANLLVAELVLPMTWLGAALAMAAPVPYLGAILALPTLGLASLLVGIVDWLAQAPGAAVATGRPSVLFAVLWYAMLGCWVGAGSADVRALDLRPPILRVGAVVAAVLALVVAVVPLGQSDAVEVSLLDVAAGAAFVRTPGGRTAVLVTADDAPGLRASVGQRLRGLVERPEILVAPTDAGAVADLLARYPPSTSLLGSGSEIAPGTQVDVGDGAIVEVVDVRQVDERLVLDLLVLVDDLAIWLPGPGRPSARWADAPADRALLRLPTTAAAWLRDPTPRSWLAIVGQTPRTDVPPELGAVFLDQRSLGAVEVRLAAGDLTVLTERCEGSAGCEVMISQAE